MVNASSSSSSATRRAERKDIRRLVGWFKGFKDAQVQINPRKDCFSYRTSHITKSVKFETLFFWWMLSRYIVRARENSLPQSFSTASTNAYLMPIKVSDDDHIERILVLPSQLCCLFGLWLHIMFRYRIGSSAVKHNITRKDKKKIPINSPISPWSKRNTTI